MAIINPAELDLKEEFVVKINRTAKVTSRGKRFRFSALVVVGDGNSHVEVGLGKANEVLSAIQKGKKWRKGTLLKYLLLMEPYLTKSLESMAQVKYCSNLHLQAL